jgi:hypothetical protein
MMSNVCAREGEFGAEDGRTVDMGELLYRPIGPKTEIAEVAPEQCPAGHALRPPNVLVGWDGTGRTYTCWICLQAGTKPYTMRYR